MKALRPVACLGVLLLLACVSAQASPESQQLTRLFGRLLTRNPRQLERTARAFEKHGAASLPALKKNFPEHSLETHPNFREAVLPSLPAEEVGVFLLQEFRVGLSTRRDAEALGTRLRDGKEGREAAETYARLLWEYKWWRWCLAALTEVRYAPAYDVVHAALLEQDHVDVDTGLLARVLAITDEARAAKDFEGLLLSPDLDDRAKGARAFASLDREPEPSTLQAIFSSGEAEVLDAGAALISHLGRQHLDLLLSLLESPSEDVRGAADRRLAGLAHLTFAQAHRMSPPRLPPGEWARRWRQWWERNGGLPEEELKAQAARAFVAERAYADEAWVPPAYADREEVRPLFREGLSRDRRSEVAVQLGELAAEGHTWAADMLVEHCSSLSGKEGSELAEGLGKSQDPRAVPLLLGWLETPRELYEPWRSNMLFWWLQKRREPDESWRLKVLSGLGYTGDPEVIDVLLEWIVEEGEWSAAEALPWIRGAESTVPRLLEALVDAEGQNVRGAIVRALERVADDAVAPELTQLLSESMPATPGASGVHSNLLELMEHFPDPDAKPLLDTLLQTGDNRTACAAAAVLGELGDYSGVDELIKRAATSDDTFLIGYRLRGIDAPGTRDRLAAAYEQAQGAERVRHSGGDG